MTISVNDISGFVLDTTNPGYLLQLHNHINTRLLALGIPSNLVDDPVIPPTQFRAPVQLEYAKLASGTVFFVNSTHTYAQNAAGYGQTPDAPFATLAYALTQTTANKGDLIIISAGHTETVPTGGLACSTAGVHILGLGWGSLKPTFTWNATDSVWTISAANVRIQNIRCTVSIDEVVKLFSVTAAHAQLSGVDYFETTSAQAIQFLLTNASADNLLIENCRHYQVTAAAAASKWIELVGADRAVIRDNFFRLVMKDDATACVINGNTTANLGIEISRNIFVMTGYSSALLSVILLANGSTGMIADNRIGTDVLANTSICDGGNAMYHANNLCTNAADKSGILDPVADT